jgi:hypothetical protein
VLLNDALLHALGEGDVESRAAPRGTIGVLQAAPTEWVDGDRARALDVFYPLPLRLVKLNN